MLHTVESNTGETIGNIGLSASMYNAASCLPEEFDEKKVVRAKPANKGMVSGQDVTEAKFAEELEIAELTLNITNPDVKHLLADDSEFDAEVLSFAFLFALLKRHPEHKSALLQKALANEERFLKLFYGSEQNIFLFPRIVHHYLPEFARVIKLKFLTFLYQKEESFDKYISSLPRIEQFYAVFSAVGHNNSEKELQFCFAQKIFGDLKRYQLVKGIKCINNARAAINASVVWCDSMALRISDVVNMGANGLMDFAQYASMPGEPSLFLAFLNAHSQRLAASPNNENKAALIAAVTDLQNHLKTKLPKVKSLTSTCAEFINTRYAFFSAQLAPVSTVLNDVTFRQNTSTQL